MGPLGSLKVHVLYRKENRLSVSYVCGHVGMWDCKTSDVEGTQNKDVMKRCRKCGISREIFPFQNVDHSAQARENFCRLPAATQVPNCNLPLRAVLLQVWLTDWHWCIN